MEVQNHIWWTIFGFIGLSIVISIVTHLWIRHHLKNKSANSPTDHLANPSVRPNNNNNRPTP